MAAQAEIIDIGDFGGPTVDDLKPLVEELGVEALSPEEYEVWRAFRKDTQEFWEDPEDHYANLVHELAKEHKNWLGALGGDLRVKVENDERSRESWQAMEQEGIRYLGVSPNIEPSADFDGASDAVHPIFAEACVQFESRAMRVLWPPGGPVKATPLGQISAEKYKLAQRVQSHMNYHFTHILKDARAKQAKLMFRLPVSGSYFTKPFYDHINKVVDRAMVPPEFMVVPFKAESLENAPRYTETCRVSRNDVAKKMRSGEFYKCDLVGPNENADQTDAYVVIEAEKKAAEGREENQFMDEDDRHTLYYTVTDLDVPGFEDQDDDDEATEVALPYLVVTDRDTQKVLSITRMWREGDPLKKRLVEYSHYTFVPGLGFYGYGFYHLIGGLIRGATGSFRGLLDAAGFANFKGGIKNSDIKIKGDGKKIGHGVFADAEWGGDGPLRDQIVTLQYGEPSSVLYKLLGDMVDWAHRLMGITDASVGDGTSTVPVGTQLSRVEQSAMVSTEIHKAIHAVQAQEFARMAELMYLWGEDEYAYDVPNESRTIKRQDFDPAKVEVGLISDPEFSSNSQRYYIAEASLTIADRNPGVYDQEELHRRAQNALMIQDVDTLIPRKTDMAQRMSPVEENAAMLTSVPVKAFIEQDHQAHIMVHEQAKESLGKGQADLIGVFEAHIREHIASAYLVQMQQMIGIPLEMPDAEEMSRGEYVPADPQLENEIAVRSAQAAQQMAAQAAAAQQQEPSPELIEMQRKQDREDMVAQADNARRDAMAEASIQRANLQAQEKGQIATLSTLEKENRENAKVESDIQRKNVESVESRMLNRQEQREEQPGVPE